MNTLVSYGKCQHCGSPLKVNIWKRKMRWREAYGILAVVIGLALAPWIRGIGVITVLVGLGLIAYGFFQTRVRL